VDIAFIKQKSRFLCLLFMPLKMACVKACRAKLRLKARILEERRNLSSIKALPAASLDGTIIIAG